MKKGLLFLFIVSMAMSAYANGTSDAPAAAADGEKKWVVGFSQIGSESEWRTANTISVQNTFNDDPSFILIYSDAQQ
ncbi:hypothetical protein [Oceanispirochaeta sp.]|jgi:hypothetical protein|uniref:hypothetical protein n=1 Tax=Oceanispirochaeta sp. TaxID=2035350 RepID=UPI00260EB51B|nr:hypothetical protein [Oceanispirochaeta sp.]MDA3958631.1 hypothetical protein [Oceanispirochaeta sp.]